MSYTAFTALIFTIHHLGAVTAFILASAFSSLAYLLVIRRYHHRVLLFIGVFLLSFMACSYFAYELFRHQVISLEIVQTK